MSRLTFRNTFGPCCSQFRGSEYLNDKHNDESYIFIQSVGGRQVGGDFTKEENFFLEASGNVLQTKKKKNTQQKLQIHEAFYIKIKKSSLNQISFEYHSLILKCPKVLWKNTAFF